MSLINPHRASLAEAASSLSNKMSASATVGRLGWVVRLQAIAASRRGAKAGSGETARSVPTPASAHLFAAGIRVADFLILLASGALAGQACAAAGLDVKVGEQTLATLAAAGVALFVLGKMDAYALSRLRNARPRLHAVALAVACGGAAAAACFMLMPVFARALLVWPVAWACVAGGLMAGSVCVSAYSARSSANAERLARRVAVVGVNAYSEAFISRLTSDPAQAATFVGLYDDGEPSDASGAMAVQGPLQDLVARTQRERVDAVVLVLPMFDQERIVRARSALRSVTVDIYMAAEILDLTCKAGQMDRVGPNAVIKIESRPLTEWQTLQKTAVDWVLCAILMVAALPALALIAIAIRLDSPGPVLFRQPRLGFNNTLFDVYKFRTMYHHMADLTADRQTTRGDPRITRVGRILRKTSLDEVPQILNVLRGDMSLVGPRPHALNTKAGNQLFHDAVADYALRHRVKPGITGWAQVNGWRGETRTREQIEQRVAHDLHYIDNWSLALDVKIIVLTALRELNSKVAF